MRFGQFVTLSFALLLTASCATSTQENEQGQIAVEAVETPTSWTVNVEESDTALTQWLEQFNDPQMLQLIAEGKANNHDLQVTAGNMNRAWLLAEQSGAALKPTADLSLGRAQSGSVDGGDSNQNATVGHTSSWELDVWGRIRSGISAAEASAQAAEADYVFAQRSLSANIAKSYFNVIEAKLQADITRKNLAILEKSMRITQSKYDHGLVSGQDVALNRADLLSAQEQLITIEGSQRDAIRALELLLGRYPNAKLDIADGLPQLPPSPPAGSPSSMLERRPDIIAAERKIASAFDATSAAKAAQLPRFSLTANLGGASSSLSDVLDPANVAWQLGANLMAPLFDGGRLRIDVELATVEQQQALSNYVQIALTAFTEVENSLDQGQVLANREVTLSKVQKHSDKAFYIAELRYNLGESELLDTLQIQQKAMTAASNLLSVRRLQLEQRINLYLALGGDW